MIKFINIFLLVLIVIGIGLLFTQKLWVPKIVSVILKYETPQNTVIINDKQACTEEAKQCPDGSYVGRTGPNCTFATCPITTPQVKGKGTLQGTISIGPICPVERIDQPCNPSPEMYAANKIFVYNSDRSKLITTLTPDAQGKFSTFLTSGKYLVDVKNQANRVGSVSGVPVEILISGGKTETITIRIDTGIR